MRQRHQPTATAVIGQNHRSIVDRVDRDCDRRFGDQRALVDEDVRRIFRVPQVVDLELQQIERRRVRGPHVEVVVDLVLEGGQGRIQGVQLTGEYQRPEATCLKLGSINAEIAVQILRNAISIHVPHDGTAAVVEVQTSQGDARQRKRPVVHGQRNLSFPVRIVYQCIWIHDRIALQIHVEHGKRQAQRRSIFVDGLIRGRRDQDLWRILLWVDRNVDGYLVQELRGRRVDVRVTQVVDGDGQHIGRQRIPGHRVTAGGIHIVRVARVVVWVTEIDHVAV